MYWTFSRLLSELPLTMGEFWKSPPVHDTMITFSLPI